MRTFICKVGFEIDGRDADYEHIGGVVMDCENNQDNWDALISNIPDDMTADMTTR